MPVNIRDLDSVLLSCLRHNKIDVDYCYTEYIDLEKDKILDYSKNTIKPEKSYYCVETETIPIDIINTRGLRSYIVLNIPTLWQFTGKIEFTLICFFIISLIIGIIVYVYVFIVPGKVTG